MSIAKVQHYVPKFLLRNFGTGKKKKLKVFDKQTGNQFEAFTRRIAAESRFYDFEVGESHLTIEPGLSIVESKAKSVIQKILDKDSLAILDEEDYADFYIFLAIQLTRTKASREQHLQVMQSIENKLLQLSGTDERKQVVKDRKLVPDKNSIKAESASIILKAPENFGPILANKDLLLLKTTGKDRFLIGDNPIGLQNTNDFSPYGNLGIGVPGIEIYLPLSPTRALALWCPTIMKVMRQEKRLKHVNELVACFEAGSPVAYLFQNTLNFNSLQVEFSERFLFSSDTNFSIAEKMISNNKDFMSGPRFTIG